MEYGYALGIFYPDFFLYPGVLMRFLGLSPELAMKFLICLCFLATCFTSYIAGKNIGRDEKVGLIVMIIYTMGHYHLEDIYRRNAYGEFVAMIFIPLFFWGLYDLTENGYKKKGILCVAFTGLMLSHTISLVLCLIIAVVWVIIRIKKILKKRIVMGVLLEAAICLILTAYYWLPVFEQFLNDDFSVSINHYFYTHEETLRLADIYSGQYSISFLELAIMVLLIAYGIKIKKYSKKAVVFFLCSVVMLIAETDIFPWKLIDKTPLVSIQFPYRLNEFTEFLAALAIACQLKALLGVKLNSKSLYYASVICGCILLGLFHVIMIWQVEIQQIEIHYYKDYPENFLYEKSYSREIGCYEWLPASFDLNETIYSENINMVLTDNGYYDGTYNDDGSFTYEPDGYYGYAVFPKTYYKGYAATAVFADGTGAEITVYESDNGLVGVYIPEGAESVTVWYEGTIIQKVSAGISLVALFIIIILMIYCKHRRKYVTIADISNN